MNFKKLISLFLAALMLCSALTGLAVVPAYAAEAAEEETTAPVEDDGPGEGESYDEWLEKKYLTTTYASPEEKVASMKKMTTKSGFELYADERTGEVAVKDLATGQIMLSNPYDISSTNSSDNIKKELFSQLQVTFKMTVGGNTKEYNTFVDAAMRQQIKVKNIKGGIRVEYTMGREEARYLVPGCIEESRFEEMILAPLEEGFGVTKEEAKDVAADLTNPLCNNAFNLLKILAYFQYQNLDEKQSDTLKQDLLDAFPVTAKMNIYVLSSDIVENEKAKIEQWIKTYCPNYSYEEMDYDHQLTEFVSDDDNPPVFKMALEYELTDDGFSVRLPANGIRYNESKFSLQNIVMLPYMGAGNNSYEGYVFYPDGSGALFAFEDQPKDEAKAVSGKVYGIDYAYHKITEKYQQTIRYPVFGIVEKTRLYDCLFENVETGESSVTTVNGMVYDAVLKAQKDGTTSTAVKNYSNLINNSEITEYIENRGFLAIIEQGDALTQLNYTHGGATSPYDSLQMTLTPRPQDSYNIADAISVGSNSEYTVTSERKYVGSYKVRYVMLSDETIAKDKDLPADSWYPATWLGMAIAYRDYLEKGKVLSRLSAEKTSGDIPLYIESFGAMETIEKILSIPVEVMRPLTSTQDIVTMYEELSGKGATNINFKLTGYANGGMYATAPYKLKWEKAVTDELSMQELLDYAAGVENGNLGIFPEFDFSYVMMTDLFDGFSMRKHAVRTIDDRYTYKREYMATRQKRAGYFQLAISPAYFHHFYEELLENYLGYENITGISVGSLGEALNSDFDEDEPYNREDSKGFVSDALKYISGANDGKLDVMVDGGNAYALGYADHILNAALDSSRYNNASYSVPFVGVVLHGYVNFAGAPLNMEGDVNYAKLKAIENGASVYFTLSYRNTQNLKEDFYLSKYYSVRYDIWFDDVVEIYNELNSELKDVQDKLIIDHQFLSGMRVPDTGELDRDINAEYESILDDQLNKAENDLKKKVESVADARDKIASVQETAKRFVKDYLSFYSGINGAAYLFVTGNRSLERRYAAYYEAKAAFDKIDAEYKAASEEDRKALEEVRNDVETVYTTAKNQLRTYIRNVARAINTIEKEYEALNELLEAAKAGELLIKGTEGCPQSIITEIERQLANTEEYMAEQLGIKFINTVDKAEVDTFLHTHIATLVVSCFGSSNHDSMGDVGKAENLYKMLVSGNYGLLSTELDLLRYLPENKELTDAELTTKYGLSENKSSVDGLVKYFKELLGDEYKFDPLVEQSEGGVDQAILDYFEQMLYYMIVNNDSIPTLNFNPTKLNDKGSQTSNSSAINSVMGLIDAEINKLLTGDEGVINNVTDGNYDLASVLTEQQMNDLVVAITKVINDNIRTQQNPNPKYPVEYLTPDTMESDIRNYIDGFYYSAVINKIAPVLPKDLGALILPVRNVSYTTDNSISLIVNNALNAMPELSNDDKYGDLINFIKTDAAWVASVNTLNDIVKGTYGDVTEDLKAAFLKAFVPSFLDKKAPTLTGTAKDKETTPLISAALADLLAVELPNTTLDNVDELVAKIVALHDAYDVKETYDIEAQSKAVAYHNVLKALTEVETSAYYYDEQMAGMDATILEKVENVKAAILASFNGKEPTLGEIYNKIAESLANPEDSVYDFVATVAEKIDYRASDNANLEDDIFQYYCYRLFHAFEEYGLVAPKDFAIEIEGWTKTNCDNANKILVGLLDGKDVKRVDELLRKAKAATERGEMPNYALSAEDVEALIQEMLQKLIDTKYDVNDQNRDQVMAMLEEYLYNAYYYILLDDTLDAVDLPTFHVSEIYGGSLYEATMSFKTLLYYFMETFTEFDADDINALIAGGSGPISGTEEEEASRYLSDDGRIVSVTYGTKNADGSYSAYKTFILNYNNFSVNVEYEDVTYTIPAYGYVVVRH